MHYVGVQLHALQSFEGRSQTPSLEASSWSTFQRPSHRIRDVLSGETHSPSVSVERCRDRAHRVVSSILYLNTTLDTPFA